MIGFPDKRKGIVRVGNMVRYSISPYPPLNPCVKTQISYFDRLHFIEFMNKTGIGPILASTQCRYKIPLTYPDSVTVGTKVETIEEERFIMKYAVVSHSHKKIAALGEGVIVTFDYQKNKKAIIPDEIRKRIIDLEK